MITFEKASPAQAALKVSCYGPPGSGKTFTTLLVAEGLAGASGRRIAYVDTERGTDFYAVKAPRMVHPAAFDFDALYTRSLKEASDAVRALDPERYGVVVLDSMSHLWDAAIAAYEGRKTSVGSIPMHAWGAIKKPYRDLLRWLLDSPFHVFILGRQRNVFETGDDGDVRKVGVGMRAENETEYEPHICLRMESRKDKDNKGAQVVYAICEKDRTGVLAGKVIPNPDFDTFKPILSLLGPRQGKSQDPDAVAEQDAELLDREVERRKAREAELAAAVAGLTASIRSAADSEALAKVATQIKDTRGLTGRQKDTLRTRFIERQRALKNPMVQDKE